MRICILKENKGENRVFLLPADVKKLTSQKIEVSVVKSLGSELNIDDQKYLDAGAKVVNSNTKAIEESEIVLKVTSLSSAEAKLANNKLLISFVNYVNNVKQLLQLTKNNVTCLGWTQLDFCKDTNFHDYFDGLRGRHSVLKAASLLEKTHKFAMGKTFGKMSKTNLSTDYLILNASFAGVEATLTALALGGNVTLLDDDVSYLKSFAKDERIKVLVKNFGGKFETAKNDFPTLEAKIKKCDVFINTTVGGNNKNKKRLTQAMILSLRQNAVIVDASAEQGFGFELSKKYSSEPTYYKEYVEYVNNDILALYPVTCSEIVSNYSVDFIKHIAQSKDIASAIKLEFAKPLVITNQSKIINPELKKNLNV